MTSRSLPTAALRRATHDVTGWIWSRSAAPEVKTFRRRLGLPAEFRPTHVRHQHDLSLGVCTWSPSLVPRPADYPASIHQTGAWTPPAEMRAAGGEALPAELADWIAAGDPPVFLGFGSMPVLQPGPLLDDIVAVTRSLGVRAVLSAGWADRHTPNLPDHVRLVGAVDHDLLLPLCAAAVHHGGTGTVAASTRAGCPTVVCSVFVDQPWWGERLKELGVGAHVRFKKLDRPRLEAALSSCARRSKNERGCWASGSVPRATGCRRRPPPSTTGS